MSKALVWLGGIFAAVGLIFAGAGGWLYLADRGLAANGVHTQGTVIDVVSSRDSDGDTSYRPVVEFLDESGARHEFVGKVGSNPPAHSTGERVDVIYSPWSPADAIIDGFVDRFLLPLVFGVFGTVFAVVGGGILFAWFRRRKIVARLIAGGMPIEAKFVDCYRDTSVKVNGRSPYRVTCQASHPATGKLMSFKSDAIWADPTEKLAGREVRVLIDPAKPKHYYVDLSPYLDESAVA